MTYGEYKVWQKEHMEMRNGEIWFPDRAHDKRLMPNLAIVYYNRKLYDAWIEVGAIKRAKPERIGTWKDFWHMAENVVDKLPLRMQKAVRDVFAHGYALGYEKGMIHEKAAS